MHLPARFGIDALTGRGNCLKVAVPTKELPCVLGLLHREELEVDVGGIVIPEEGRVLHRGRVHVKGNLRGPHVVLREMGREYLHDLLSVDGLHWRDKKARAVLVHIFLHDALRDVRRRDGFHPGSALIANHRREIVDDGPIFPYLGVIPLLPGQSLASPGRL